MSINAIEGYPVEDFSAEAVKSQIAEAQKIASGSGSEQDIAEAKIELEVCIYKHFWFCAFARNFWMHTNDYNRFWRACKLS